jgi:hypothetical protein
VPVGQADDVRPELPEFAELLTRRPSSVARLARRLRAAVLAAMPDLVERFYPGWQGLGLHHPVAGLLGTIFPRDEDVVVYLEHGAAIPDPHHLLAGQGRLRQTRMLTFRSRARTPTEAQLVEYFDLALDLALTRKRR